MKERREKIERRKFWKYCVRVYFFGRFSVFRRGSFVRFGSFYCALIFNFFFHCVLPSHAHMYVYTQRYKISSHVPIVSSVSFYCIQFVCRRFALRKYFGSLKLFFLYYFYSLLSFKLSTCHRGKKSFLLNFNRVCSFFFHALALFLSFFAALSRCSAWSLGWLKNHKLDIFLIPFYALFVLFHTYLISMSLVMIFLSARVDCGAPFYQPCSVFRLRLENQRVPCVEGIVPVFH